MIFDQNYMQLCSEKTLQSDKEGFFLQFVNSVAESVGEKWIKNVFGKLKTDNERIRIIYEDKKISVIIATFLSNVQEVYRKKCPLTSKNRLIEAQSTEKTGDLKKALNLYSQAILKCPDESTLGVAYLSRAKTLICLNAYSNALTDLQLSLTSHIPPNLKYEVLWLMGLCYKALNIEEKAKISFDVTEKLIKNVHLLKILRHIQIKNEPMKTSNEKRLPIIDKNHARFPHASNKITVKNSREMGRFVTANERIDTGEVLVVEPPQVACLLPEKFGTHCHHCFERFVAPIGCRDCVGVAFCSLACRDSALLSYHKYECKFLDLLIGSGMSVLSLAALRSVTQLNLTNCLKFCQSKTDGVFNLCTNSDKRHADDFLQRTLMAAFLLTCLQKSGYFGKINQTGVPTEEEYQIGEMLLYYLQILQFNAHEISETIQSDDGKLSKLTYIGVAVYPTVSLFNHECYPAVTRYFVGKYIVIKALRPLTPTTIIAENYGPIFTCRSLTDRQRLLSARYWFHCKCQACVEDWSLLSNESSTVKRIRCPNGHLFTNQQKCPKCDANCYQQIKNLEWCENQYELGANLMKKQKYENAIDVLKKALECFHRISTPPYKKTHLAEENLRLCLAQFGNVYLIKK